MSPHLNDHGGMIFVAWESVQSVHVFQRDESTQKCLGLLFLART